MSNSEYNIIKELDETNDIRTYLMNNKTNVINFLSNKYSNRNNTSLEVGERPWGNYYVFYGSDIDKIKIKAIVVNPHSKLSYQSHKFRKEHWICYMGSGLVVLDNNIIPLKEELIFIDLEQKHRLVNNTSEELIVFEIQEALPKYYLGEDDIMRYDDDYDRV